MTTGERSRRHHGSSTDSCADGETEQEQRELEEPCLGFTLCCLRTCDLMLNYDNVYQIDDVRPRKSAATTQSTPPSSTVDAEER